MRQIYEISNRQLKEKYADRILRLLPEWFGLEEGIKNYVSATRDSLFFISESSGEIEGFICVKQHNDLSAEILSMGVRKEVQGSGIGKRLIIEVEKTLLLLGVKYLQVKTLGPSANCEYYEKTRAFYHAMGFDSLEENTEIWGVENPCLIMVKFMI